MLKSPIDLAVPVFYAAIALEGLVSARRRDGRVPLRGTLTNISLGIGNFVADFFWILLYYRIYSFFYAYSPWKIPTHVIWGWILLFFLDDLAFYWFHRASHRVRLLWAAHVVHHSSEGYSFSTAARQPWTEGAFVWPFWAPLALLGFHPFSILVMQSLSLVYQFFLHTQYVGKRRGWLESVLNTPSHHRAHHGRNAEYIDRNYGGVLIVWDRLFGTFEPEQARVDYGITTPLLSHNPLVIAFHEYGALARDLRRSGSWREVLGRVAGGPEWTPGSRRVAPPVAPRPLARPRPARVRSVVLAALVLAVIPVAWAFAAEAYMQDAIASELAAEAGSVAGFRGVLEERGAIGSSVAVSRVAFRAPASLRVEALEPEAVRGDVLALSSGTLVVYSRRRDAAFRVAHVPVPDAAGEARLARELVRARVADYAYEALPSEVVAQVRAVPWRATPRRREGFLTSSVTWLAEGLSWPLRARLESPSGGAPYASCYREAGFGPVSDREVAFELPATASVVEWDLEDASLTRDAARAQADFPLLEPGSDVPLGLERTRIVRARAHWPPMLALVYERGPFLVTVTELADRGLVEPSLKGWPVALGSNEARVSFVAGWTIVVLVRDGVSLTVLANVPEAEALTFAASLAPR